MGAEETLARWAIECGIVLAIIIALAVVYVIQRVFDAISVVIQFLFDCWRR